MRAIIDGNEIQTITGTRPRGQGSVLGLKIDIDKERESLVLTERPTNISYHRDAGTHIKHIK